jgi:ATP synthase H subunit
MTREDVLRSIKNAEIAATETLSNAKKEAASIISQARQNASEILTSGRSDSESNAQGLISKARESAGSEAEVVSNDGKVAQKSIHDSGIKNRQKAEKIVIDAFRN